jgi:hypothetical protein
MKKPMTVNLTIPIECGEDLCCTEKADFCRFYEYRKSEFNCNLFTVALSSNAWGIPMRCIQCKEADKSVDIEKLASELMKKHSKVAYERLDKRLKLQSRGAKE